MWSLISAVICAIPVAVAVEYNESRAILFANLAGASYCRDDFLHAWDCGAKCDAVKGVSSIKLCSAGGTKAFVALWEGKCVISFKGTNRPIDVIRDGAVTHKNIPWGGCPGCLVHGGFLDDYMVLQSCIKAQLKANACHEGSAIRSTGHSLGAAASSLAMMDLYQSGWIIEESYDFGRPRVGGEDYAKVFNAFFGSSSWRVTHARDPIPMIPFYIVDFHWTHTEPEAYYVGDNKDGHVMCTDPSNHTGCIEQHTFDATHILDHEHYMDVSIGTFGCRLIADRPDVVDEHSEEAKQTRVIV